MFARRLVFFSVWMGWYFVFLAIAFVIDGSIPFVYALPARGKDFRNVMNADPPLHMEKKIPVFKDAKCLLCTFAMREGLAKIKEYKNTSEVLELIKQACILLRMESPEVCEGGVDIVGKRAAEVIKKSRVRITAEDACFLAFPDRCTIDKMSSLAGLKWKVKIPKYGRYGANCKQPTMPKNDKILKALHISDIHVDMLYSPGSVAQCGKPICCRASPKSNSSHDWSAKAYSVISKFGPIKYDEVEQPLGAGRWGDYRGCDLPPWTLEHMLETVSNGSLNASFVASNGASASQDRLRVDYVVWTGDIASHDIWEQSESRVKHILNYLTQTLLKHFPKTKVFPVVGNHDSFPPNSFPSFREKSAEGRSDRWIYDVLAEAWSHWLTDDALKTVRLGGYYTTIAYPGFRIVSLNTNFCYTENYWIYFNPEDPGQMLAWFVSVLLKAENNGEKVHVIGHVPPGRSPDCLESWSENYFRIVQRFKCTITGQLFGHTHFDELQLIYGEKYGISPPILVAYLAPSVTPYADMNPAFRIYDIDGQQSGGSWSILDYRTYAMDLDDANKLDKPLWKLEYSAKNAYNISSLAPKQWHNLVLKWEKFFQSGHTVPPRSLVSYMQYFSRGRFQKSTAGESSAGNSNLPCETMKCAKWVVCNIIKNRDMDFCSE